jgi:hypothetical protein
VATTALPLPASEGDHPTAPPARRAVPRNIDRIPHGRRTYTVVGLRSARWGTRKESVRVLGVKSGSRVLAGGHAVLGRSLSCQAKFLQQHPDGGERGACLAQLLSRLGLPATDEESQAKAEKLSCTRRRVARGGRS